MLVRLLFGETQSKHFDGINTGDQGKISYMRLKFPLQVNFNVRVLSKWSGRYRSWNASWNKYTHGRELHLRTSASKDFCTPVINEVCSGSQEGKFWGKTCVQKNVSYCSLFLQTGIITATVRDSCHYSNDLLQGGLEDRLLHFFVYGRSACWSLCCDNEFTFNTKKLLAYHFSINTAAKPFNFPIVMWREENDT